jgi:hypothetical protein
MAAQRPEHAHATDRPTTATFHDTSRTHYNWMAARQTSCRQQTAPAQSRSSKDVTAHPHRPGARPGRPCPVPACSGQPPSGRSGFSSPFGTEFFCFRLHHMPLAAPPSKENGRKRAKSWPCRIQKDATPPLWVGKLSLYRTFG